MHLQKGRSSLPIIYRNMEASENTIKLYYNTEVEKLGMPEYGRNVLKMVEQLRDIPDREKRTQQAAAVVKVMESLNPQVHQQDNWKQKLWDHLFMIAGYDLDVDSPYPKPLPEAIQPVVRYRRERGDIRQLLHKLCIIRDHRRDARLLQHDLADPDGVRIAGIAPRQITVMRRIPVHQKLDKFHAYSIA